MEKEKKRKRKGEDELTLTSLMNLGDYFGDYDRHLFVVIRIRRDSKVSYGSGLVITFLS